MAEEGKKRERRREEHNPGEPSVGRGRGGGTRSGAHEERDEKNRGDRSRSEDSNTKIRVYIGRLSQVIVKRLGRDPERRNLLNLPKSVNRD
jgi:hypothetical protein